MSNFDHSQDSLVKACGYTEEEVEKTISKLKATMFAVKRPSQAVELMCENFNLKEVSFLLAGALFQKADVMRTSSLDSKKAQLLKKILEVVATKS